MRLPVLLLADDHPGLLEIVHRMLSPSFELIEKVGDGGALIEAAAKLKPDVIVTDITMPVLNGIEAVSRLRDSGCESKIVFLTIHSDPDFVRACLSLGALGYVLKRRIATDLLPAVRAALAGKVYVSEKLDKQGGAQKGSGAP